jgi:hypothetical protein
MNPFVHGNDREEIGQLHAMAGSLEGSFRRLVAVKLRTGSILLGFFWVTEQVYNITVEPCYKRGPGNKNVTAALVQIFDDQSFAKAYPLQANPEHTQFFHVSQ